MTTQLEKPLQWTGIVTGALGTGFWVYTFHFISNVPQGDGTGFQWLAEFPLTMIFLLLSFPAISLGWSRRLAALSAALGISGLIAFAYLWRQLLTEFAGYK